MRTRLRASRLARDTLVGRHTSLAWWDALVAALNEVTAVYAELVRPNDSNTENRIRIVVPGKPPRELVFGARNTVSLFMVDPDRRKALEVHGPAGWRSTWWDVFRTVRNRNFFGKECFCGSKRRLGAGE